MLAEADRVRLRGPEETGENRDTIFPVVPTELGDELWKVSFENAVAAFSRKHALLAKFETFMAESTT